MLLAILLSAASVSTDGGSWTVSGPTTFLDAVTFKGSLTSGSVTVDSSLSSPTIITTIVYVNSVMPPLMDQGVVISGRRDPWDTGSTADVTIRSDRWRNAGDLLEIDNQYTRVAGVTHDATFYGGVEGGLAAFQDRNTAGNHVSFTVADKMQVVFMGRLPDAYWGTHGNITNFAQHKMIAGYISSFVNPTSGNGAITDNKLMVTHQGGVYPAGRYQRSQFAPCGEYENAPENDGGSGYYIATDAGVAHRGTLLWADDEQKWYQCCVSSGDRAGSWSDIRIGCQ